MSMSGLTGGDSGGTGSGCPGRGGIGVPGGSLGGCIGGCGCWAMVRLLLEANASGHRRLQSGGSKRRRLPRA